MMHVTKPDLVTELGAVDVTALKALIGRVSERVWNLEDERKENNFAVFHHTRHIVFRFIEGMRDHRRYYSNPIWDVWREHLQPVLDQAAASFGFAHPAYPKVMLARLAAGAVIDRHVDGAGSNLFTHKIHVPIQTNDRAIFFVCDQPFQLKEGRAYEVNNLAHHAAENLGPADRIHLIFEVFDETGPPAA
jgi:hypothetical protein